jgi:hypothetical protein
LKALHYDQPVNLDTLHDELLRAVPELRPVPGALGVPVAVMLMTGSDSHVDLQVPDEADQLAIDAVLVAHDPSRVPVVGFEPREREERLSVVLQQAVNDPAYAALASLTLEGES